MTKHFTKELDTSKETKAIEYVKEVENIKAIVADLNRKKKDAIERVPLLETELRELVTDVEIVTNDSKRKKALKRKTELQDELNELEMFAEMNVEAYETKQYEELTQLGTEARRERAEYEARVRELRDEVEQLHKEQMNEINSALNKSHPFYRYEKEYERGTLRARRERQRQESIEHSKKMSRTPLYDTDGNKIGYQEGVFDDNGNQVGTQNILFKK